MSERRDATVLVGEESRTIHCFGEIRQETAVQLIEALHHLNRQGQRGGIHLHVMSAGGSLDCAFAVYDVMQASRSPIKTYAHAMALSAGAMIYLAGAERYVYPHTQLMLHAPILDSVQEDLDGLATDMARFSSITAWSYSLLGKHTPMDAAYWRNLLKDGREHWWFGGDAVRSGGLADVVIGPHRAR